MAPKKKQTPPAVALPPDVSFPPPQETSVDVKDQLLLYAKSAIFLTLLAAFSKVSLMSLSPVYGAIPTGISHDRVLMAGCFVGWAANLALRRALPVKTKTLLPIIAAYVPVMQFFLFGFSDDLGPKWGPIVTEGATLFPLALLSASCVGDLLERAELDRVPKSIRDATPGIASWIFFTIMGNYVQSHLDKHIGTALVYTRLGMQTLIAASYALLAPSKYLVLAIPALVHTAMFNPHLATPTAMAELNSALQPQGWALLDRQESITGYISILENVERGFRVMRCDHSLLGGEWTQFHGGKVGEPVYGVFAMLEAIRLVGEKPVADTEAKALVVGLGIGTTPSALVTHGIDTTTIEIDPVVHEYAVKYFNLKENNDVIISDAVSYVAQLSADAPGTYDYIVHDVFTGGAEPVDLFTLEFLEQLGSLMKPTGVVAINYAGDFTLPAPKMIVRTITSVFPSCRIFRESPANQTAIDAGESDFTNMVIFCTQDTAPLTFRRAVRADFLDSRAREVFLQPKNEILQADILAGDDALILTKRNTKKLTKWHKQSAVGHWGVMRTVVPANIWEQW